LRISVEKNEEGKEIKYVRPLSPLFEVAFKELRNEEPNFAARMNKLMKDHNVGLKKAEIASIEDELMKLEKIEKMANYFRQNGASLRRNILDQKLTALTMQLKNLEIEPQPIIINN